MHFAIVFALSSGVDSATRGARNGMHTSPKSAVANDVS